MRPRRGRGPGPGGGAWGCQSRSRRCCRGSLHAVARWLPTLPPSARRPGIPRRLLPCWPGTQVKTAALPRHSVPSSASLRRAGAPSGLCQPRGSPCRPGAVPGGGTTVFPSPPHASRLRACLWGLRSAPLQPGVGLVPSPPSRADYTITGAEERGPLPIPGPTPVSATCSQAEGSDPARPRGPGKFHFVVRVC